MLNKKSLTVAVLIFLVLLLLINIATGESSVNFLSKGQADELYINDDGDTMVGDLAFEENINITNNDNNITMFFKVQSEQSSIQLWDTW